MWGHKKQKPGKRINAPATDWYFTFIEIQIDFSGSTSQIRLKIFIGFFELDNINVSSLDLESKNCSANLGIKLIGSDQT